MKVKCLVTGWILVLVWYAGTSPDGFRRLMNDPAPWLGMAGWIGAVLTFAAIWGLVLRPIVEFFDERAWERMKQEKYLAEVDAIRYSHSTQVVKLGDGEAALSPLPVQVRPEIVSHTTLTQSDTTEGEGFVWLEDEHGRTVHGLKTSAYGVTQAEADRIVRLRRETPGISINKIAEAVYGHHGGHQNRKVKAVLGLEEGRKA